MEKPVFCRSDYSYAQRPKSIQWGGENIQIGSLINEWFAPEGKGFMVQTVTNQVFELFYYTDGNSWDVREI